MAGKKPVSKPSAKPQAKPKQSGKTPAVNRAGGLGQPTPSRGLAGSGE